MGFWKVEVIQTGMEIGRKGKRRRLKGTRGRDRRKEGIEEIIEGSEIVGSDGDGHKREKEEIRMNKAKGWKKRGIEVIAYLQDLGL